MFKFKIDTPLCSAKRMDEVVDELHEYLNSVIIAENQNRQIAQALKVNNFAKKKTYKNLMFKHFIAHFQSIDSAKSPVSITNENDEKTKALMKEVRFRLSHISLESNQQFIESDV